MVGSSRAAEQRTALNIRRLETETETEREREREINWRRYVRWDWQRWATTAALQYLQVGSGQLLNSCCVQA